MAVKQEETHRAFLKMNHADEFVDLGEFRGDYSKIKKFLNDNLKVIITKDRQTITKYVNLIKKRDEILLDDIKARAAVRTNSRIAGFGAYEE